MSVTCARCSGVLLRLCNCRTVNLWQMNADLLRIRSAKQKSLRVANISILYYRAEPLERALNHLFVACDRAYKNGANVLILSDRGVDENHMAIPSLLAVSALEHHLINTRRRTAISVILETADPRDVHHFALLLGYGARAINPYLAQETIRQLIDEDHGTEVCCHFCGKKYAFSEDQLRDILELASH